jgi:hypothetical protein
MSKQLMAKKAMATDNQTGTSCDSIQVLVSLEEPATHHLDEISLTADQQATNHKVLSDEFMNVFTHYIAELYSTRDCDVKLNISRFNHCNYNLLPLLVSFIQQTKVNILL